MEAQKRTFKLEIFKKKIPDECKSHLMRQNPRTELALKGQKEEPPLRMGATHIFMIAGGRRGAGQETEK